MVARGVPIGTANSFGASAAAPVLLVLIAASLLGLSPLIAINFIIYLMLATSRLLCLPMARRLHQNAVPMLRGVAFQPNPSIMCPLQMATFATGSGKKPRKTKKVVKADGDKIDQNNEKADIKDQAVDG